MIVNSMIAADCHHQEDVEACKLVVMVANPNPIQLFIGLARLFILLLVTWFLVLLQ